MRSNPKHVVHVEEKEKKEEKATRPVCVTERNTLEWRAEAREPFGHCEINTSERFNLRRCSLCEEIERNTIKVWESEKEKGDIFLCSSYTQGR